MMKAAAILATMVLSAATVLAADPARPQAQISPAPMATSAATTRPAAATTAANAATTTSAAAPGSVAATSAAAPGSVTAASAVVPASAGDQLKPPSDAAGVAKLVADLGDQKWAARQAAEQVLTAMSRERLSLLDPHLARAADAEVLWRLERVYRSQLALSALGGRSAIIGFMGVQIDGTPTEEIESLLGPRERGMLLRMVVPESPAAKAGLRPGDIVVALNGQKFVGDFMPEHLTAMIRRLGEGGEAVVTFFRDRQRRELTVILGNPTTVRPNAEPGTTMLLSPEEASSETVVEGRWQKFWQAYQAAAREKYGAAAGPGPANSGGTTSGRTGP